MRRLALLLLLLPLSCTSEESKPNFVLISIDNLGANHMGCYRYFRDTSPFMDSLAEKGMVFERMVAQDTWTLPSHTSMLTSRYVTAHGVWHSDFRLNADSPVLVQEVLHREGYRTAAFTACIFVSGTYGLDRGFDHFSTAHRSAEEVNRDVLDYVSTRSDEPFFLFLHYYDVHLPFVEKNPYGEQFTDEYYTFVGEVMWKLKTFADREVASITEEEIRWLVDTFPNFEVEALLAQAKEEGAVVTKQNVLELSAHYLQLTDPKALEAIAGAYDNGIAFMDMHLGELFRELEKYPWYENTIFLITSDHGEAFNQHQGVTGHGGPPFDELVHVPFIVTGPGIPAATRIPVPVAGIDIAPTMLELAGIAPGRDFQGASLVPLITGAPFKPRPIVAGCTDKRTLSLQEGSWKMVLDTRRDMEWLYNIDAPGGESTNLLEAHPERAEALKEKLLRSEKYNRRAGESLKKEKVELNDEERARLKELGYL